MLHPEVRNDPRQAEQHEILITTRLVGGGLALAAFPLYLALHGAPSFTGAIVFAGLLLPLAIAFYLSRTGLLARARLSSSLALAALLGLLAAASGGLESPLLALLLLVPVEAATWRSRRLFMAATGFAAAAVAFLAVLGIAGMLPANHEPAALLWALAALGALPAVTEIAALARGSSDAAEPAMAPTRATGRPLGALVEHGPDIVTRHRRNGNLVYVSPAAQRSLGVHPDELLGCGLFRRIHLLDRPAFLTALDAAAMSGEAMAELRLNTAEAGAQHWRWFELRCRALPEEAGEGPELVAVLRDVSALKAQERSFVEAFEHAERRSIAKTRFLARISHELRTPLNAIIGFSELLSQPPLGPLPAGKQHEYAELIRDSGRHLLDLINDILDMSKLETGSFRIVPEAFDLAALVENCRQLLEPQAAAAGLTIESDLPVGLAEPVADRRACKQMLLNLLHNAIKFSRRGGRIVVGAYTEDDVACFYVADEGIGIAADDVSRLGQPFVQLHSSYDRNYEGAGLGLSVVKGLVALHGGSLEIDSTPGVGTRVTVRLPLLAAPVDVDIDAQRDADQPLRLSA